MNISKLKTVLDQALMIVQSLAILAIIGLITYCVYLGYSFATGYAFEYLTGSAPSNTNMLYVWLALGIAGTWVWPIKYRQNMRGEDWVSVLKGTPFFMFAGPLALVLSYPL